MSSGKLSEATNIDAIQVQEQSSVAQPSTGFGKFYFKTDGKPYAQNDAGTETDLTSGGAGGDATGIALTDATELTISSGAVTKTQTYHSIDTESDASSDDLDTISGGTAGEIVYIFAVNDARTVVVKNGTGNILTYSGNDISLDEDHKILGLLYDGTNWREISNADSTVSGSGIAQVLTQHIAKSTNQDTSSTTYAEASSSFRISITTTGGDCYAEAYFRVVNLIAPGGFYKLVLHDGTSVVDADNDSDTTTAELNYNHSGEATVTIRAKWTSLAADSYTLRIYFKADTSGSTRLMNLNYPLSMMIMESA